MSDKIGGAVSECVTSVSRNPLMALLLIIFLVQSWMMTYKLDTINQTLLKIHDDNIQIQNYTKDEDLSSEKYVAQMETVNSKLDILMERID